MFKRSCEDPKTLYICLFGRRFIFRDKKYCGWYKVKLLPDLILQTSHGELNYAYVQAF